MSRLWLPSSGEYQMDLPAGRGTGRVSSLIGSRGFRWPRPRTSSRRNIRSILFRHKVLRPSHLKTYAPGYPAADDELLDWDKLSATFTSHSDGRRGPHTSRKTAHLTTLNGPNQPL